jgi:hypothetical protein
VSVTGKRGAGIPIVLLHDATGGTVTIELKNGCTYKGTLEDAQDSMNCLIKVFINNYLFVGVLVLMFLYFFFFLRMSPKPVQKDNKPESKSFISVDLKSISLFYHQCYRKLLSSIESNSTGNSKEMPPLERIPFSWEGEDHLVLYKEGLEEEEVVVVEVGEEEVMEVLLLTVLRRLVIIPEDRQEEEEVGVIMDMEVVGEDTTVKEEGEEEADTMVKAVVILHFLIGSLEKMFVILFIS